MPKSPTSPRERTPSYIPVLDHGFVRLVSRMGGDIDIVRAARVSYAADWRTGEDEGSDAKLIRFLMRNRHTTPFESVEFQFEVACPMFTRSQWHRHRTQSYNEVSARYTELPEVFYVPDPYMIGKQHPTHKQMRVTGNDLSEQERADLEDQVTNYRRLCEAQFAAYRNYLKQGWPRELARMCLPTSTYTRFFAKANLHNWLHFLGLRADSHAQYEIRVYAEAIIELIEPFVPVTMAAFRQYFSKENSK